MDYNIIYGLTDQDMTVHLGDIDDNDDKYDENYHYLVDKYDFAGLWENIGEPKGIIVVGYYDFCNIENEGLIGDLEELKIKWRKFIQDDLVDVKIGAIPKLYIGE